MRGRISKTAPCAVYRIWAHDGHLLYVGCSSNPLARVQHHTTKRAWSQEVARVDLQWFPTGAEAMVAEKAAIASEGPEWNSHFNPNPKREVGIYHPQFRRDDRSTWAERGGA